MGSYSAIPLSGIHPAYAQLEHQGEIDQLKARSLMLEPQLRQQQIEANQMAIEQQRRQVANQEIMRRALTESGGEPTKFSQLAAQYGASPDSLMALGQHFAQMRHHGAQADESEFNLRIKKADALQGAYDGFLKLPEEEKQRQFPTFSARQKARGAMTDEEATQFDQHYGGIYPGDANWASDAAQLGLHSKLMAEGVAAKNAATRQTVANTAQTRANTAAEDAKYKRPSLEAKGEQDTRASISARLASAPDALTYEKIYDALPEQNKTQGLPFPWEWDAEKTPAAVRRWGLTSAQAATDQRATDRNEQLAADSAERLKLARQRMEKENKQTLNSAAIDRRQAENQLRKSAIQEAKLLRDRQALVTAIKAGAELETKDNVKRDLYGELEDNLDELKGVIADKYVSYDYTDRQAPAMSYDQAIKNLQDGHDRILKFRKGGAEAATPTPPAVARPAPSQSPAQPQAQAQAQPNTTKTGRDNLQNWNTHLSKAGKTVKMKAPNGEVGEVPAHLVEDFKKKGAKLVQ